MTTFTIEISDASKLAGITAARESYNSTLPSTIKDENDLDIANPALIVTDDAYVQFVMDKASESYANQYGV